MRAGILARLVQLERMAATARAPATVADLSDAELWRALGGRPPGMTEGELDTWLESIATRGRA